MLLLFFLSLPFPDEKQNPSSAYYDPVPFFGEWIVRACSPLPFFSFLYSALTIALEQERLFF